MAFLPFLLNRSRLPICSYNLFLFWPVPLKSVKKKKKKKKSVYEYIYIKTNEKKKKKKVFKQLYLKKKTVKKKKKYYFFLFWPVTLQTLNGSSTVLVSTQKGAPTTFSPFFVTRAE